MTALAICFLFSWLASQMGLAPIVGAFAAGLILEKVQYRELAERHGRQELEDLIRPARRSARADLLRDDGGPGRSPELRRPQGPRAWRPCCSRSPSWESRSVRLGVLEPGLDRLSIGVGMIPRGEVGLIFAAIGRQLYIGGQRAVDDGIYSALVLMVIATTLVTPPLLKLSLDRFADAQDRLRDPEPTRFRSQNRPARAERQCRLRGRRSSDGKRKNPGDEPSSSPGSRLYAGPFVMGSEQEDHVEGQGELGLPGLVAVCGVELRPVVTGFGTDPEPLVGLDLGADRLLVVTVALEMRLPRVAVDLSGSHSALVPEDFRPPDAHDLVAEVVQEPVAEAVPVGIPGGTVDRNEIDLVRARTGDGSLPALVGFHDLGQLVVPLVGQHGREEGAVIAVVARIVQAGDRRDVDVAGRIDLLVSGQLAGELVRAPDVGEGQAGLLVLGGPGEAADVTPDEIAGRSSGPSR